MFWLKGYQLSKKVREDKISVTYRGVRESDHVPVIVKLLKSEYPTHEELNLFGYEYRITKELDLPCVVRAYSIENFGRSCALVMEDFGAIPLDKYFSNHKGDINIFLKVAGGIADIIGDLHEHNIIHLGIQPHNIFINPKTKQIKLTNFSNSVRLQMKTQIFAPQEPIQSSLFYISPEQTGQVGSSIDYRTDFYSLGVTFYEILTGRLPFLSDDSTELVYAHIAKVPAAPDSVKKKIPKVISEIVMKLLSKPAAERYRSASGLKADLEKCRRQLKETGTIEKFPIGEQDNLERFQIPEKLYGREDEQDVLLRSSKE